MIWRVGEQRKDQQNLLQLRPEKLEVRGHSLARSDGKLQEFKLVGYRCRLQRAASQKMQFTKLRLAGLFKVLPSAVWACHASISTVRGVLPLPIRWGILHNKFRLFLQSAGLRPTMPYSCNKTAISYMCELRH